MKALDLNPNPDTKSPDTVLVRVKDCCIGITRVAPDTPGAQNVCSGGTINDTKSAQKIANVLGVELPEKGTIHFGKCTYQQDKDGNVTAVVSCPPSADGSVIAATPSPADGNVSDADPSPAGTD